MDPIKAAGATVKVTVAPGNTISFGRGESFGPGKVVEVPAGERADLLARGVIVDPDAKASVPAARDGATVSSADGKSMITQA